MLHTPEQQQWLHRFISYEFEIQYKLGVGNILTNAFSSSLCIAWFELRVDWLKQLHAALLQDEELKRIMWQYESQQLQHSHYSIKNGILY